jgi:hypothetical protein
MRKRLTTLKCKSGGVQNGNGAGHPRSLIDETAYREHKTVAVNFRRHWDPKYSGWSNASRPRDFAIFLRPVID